jgi:rhodanese-related sulfurtransferase
MPSAGSIEMTPQQVQELQSSGKPVVLIDVREPKEWELTRLEGASLIPMNTVPANLQTLEGQADSSTLVIYCHHGMRSLQVAYWLREKGIESCFSMAGGIDRWSLEIDPQVPRY